MLDSLYAFFESLTPRQVARDVLDIFLVYYIVYRALLVLRGTRAMQVGVGLAMVFVLYIVAQLLQLVTVLNIMGALISSMILIIVVVFQNDIRRGLQRVGSRAWFGGLVRTQESKLIDAVVEAATDLARHRIGALITFEQDANLDEFVGVHKGHVLDAQVTRELLVTLFIPEGVNKLHDGSVIIRNYRIAKAGVFFPMPEGRVVDDSFGSRHRAALGITEETDAVVVIVSEERGTISFCFNGNIASNL
ncbi:MAG TPA: diadenylate cyclase CdaA, partial [Polyangiaceae bacterium]|nr:diadenylate cyclase CdaA [Polyangiaceae bacterium]